jgi:hypothetical protein
MRFDMRSRLGKWDVPGSEQSECDDGDDDEKKDALDHSALAGLGKSNEPRSHCASLSRLKWSQKLTKSQN